MIYNQNQISQSSKANLIRNVTNLTKSDAPVVNEFVLPSGKNITKESFVNDPLFKYAKGKEIVFNELAEITRKDGFSKDYNRFLSILSKKSWCDVCELGSFVSYYLSILAFLDRQINDHELFTIHAVTRAYQDQSVVYNGISASDVQTKVLEVEEVVEYLKKPFFDFDGLPPDILSNSKTFDLDDAKIEFLNRIEDISHIERTFLEFTVSPFKRPYLMAIKDGNMDYSVLSGFTVSYFLAKDAIGIKEIRLDDKLDQAVIVIPPIGILINLLRTTSKFGDKLLDPVLMFGHVMRYNILFKGRPFTAPSFFNVPALHDYEAGPKELAMFFHDACYHFVIDANNPHVEIFIKIGRLLLESDLSKFEDKIKYFRRFAGKILDRDAFHYMVYLPEEAFWEFIITQLRSLKKQVPLCFDDYFNEIFFPHVSEVIRSYTFKGDGSDKVADMSKDEILKMI